MQKIGQMLADDDGKKIILDVVTQIVNSCIYDEFI